MTDRQYDRLISEFRILQEDVRKIENTLVTLYNKIVNLTQKTIVISDVDKQIKQLKVDIESIKDEKEA